MIDYLSEFGIKVLCVVESYELLEPYYECESGYINIPLDEYKGNEDIFNSVKDLMMKSTFDDGEDTLFWCMSVVDGDEYQDGIANKPFVSLSLIKTSVF